MKAMTLPLIIISMLACRTQEHAGAPAGLNAPVWINDNTLEITVFADADQAEKRKAVRRAITRDDAVRKAQYLLYDATLGASSANFRKHLEIMNTNPMMFVMERTPEFPAGVIMEMKYDTDDRCTIRYRVHAIGLHEIIKRIEEKYRE